MDAIYAIGIDVILLLILGIGLGQNLSDQAIGGAAFDFLPCQRWF